MASTELAMQSIAASNIPAHEKKSLIRKMLEGGGAYVKSGRARHHASETMHTFAKSGISLLSGFALGAIHAEKGLDIKGKAPADLIMGALGAAGGVFLDGDPVSSLVAGSLGQTGISVFSFRQGYAFAAEKKAAKGGVPTGFKLLMGAKVHGDDFAGEVGEDPIMAIAQKL